MSVCDAPFLCDYISNPNGKIEIHHNAPGCSSIAQLAYNCGITLPCLSGGTYYFYSQADVDYFPLAYNNCNELTASVFVRGNDITNLEGLNGIKSISGNLAIYGNANLINLSGLDSLTTIGGVRTGRPYLP